ncbi:MAG TPA: hypothetical protein VK469_00895 [Candidatus Kapabacteria bacterium]|nr:hypothetical protein [Candidatus Kapabacteria bacterium]
MKALTLGEVIQNFNQQSPLTPKKEYEWKNLYTETKRKEIDLIKSEFLRSNPGRKVLFGGHAGNGKSTELNKFIFDPEISRRFEIIKIDILESLDPNDIDIVEFLITICFHILTFAEEKNIKIESYFKNQFEKLEGFFREKLKIETTQSKGRTKEMGIQSEAGSSFIFLFLKFKADFYAKMRGDVDSRHTVRNEYRPRINELTGLVKNLVMDIKPKLEGKEPLIIVDGLDRAAVVAAEKLFADDAQNLALIDNVSMLLTVPISLIHSVKSAMVENTVGKMHVLKNILIRTSNKTKTDETERNREAMKNAVLRRMEEKLISAEALDMAVDYAGGVFRTLIELIASAALQADVIKGTRISENDMKEAIKELRIKRSRSLSRSQWEILIEIDTNKKFTGDMDEKRLQLLAGLYVLEYINGGEWYSVNPLLESLLDEWKVIINAPSMKKE